MQAAIRSMVCSQRWACVACRPDGGLKTSETAWEGKAGESEAWDGGVGPC